MSSNLRGNDIEDRKVSKRKEEGGNAQWLTGMMLQEN